jgi:hypothetical protein
MEQAREQEIMRITAQFVAEQEAGLRPRLEDYARHYPQYVDEITDFVTYYYAVEVGLPTDTTSVPSLSAGSRAALQLAWERVNTPLPLEEVTLELLAQRQRYSFARLASLLDLDADIVERLARRQLDPMTIPREIFPRLATILSQSVSVVRQALGLPDVPATPVLTERRVVAEARVPYGSSTEQATLPSFRDAVVNSTRLSVAQKKHWLTVLKREGL